jgi:hypothetical protein
MRSMYVRTAPVTSGRRAAVARGCDERRFRHILHRPMRRVLLALVVLCLAGAAGVWIYRSRGARPAPVIYDLADRLPFAARVSARDR